MAETTEDKNISFHDLRERLQQALEVLMNVLPDGRERVLSTEYLGPGGEPSGEHVPPNSSASNLALLRDFAGSVGSLLDSGMSPGRVAEIMLQDNGVQRIFIADESFAQQYFD